MDERFFPVPFDPDAPDVCSPPRRHVFIPKYVPAENVCRIESGDLCECGARVFGDLLI